MIASSLEYRHVHFRQSRLGPQHHSRRTAGDDCSRVFGHISSASDVVLSAIGPIRVLVCDEQSGGVSRLTSAALLAGRAVKGETRGLIEGLEVALRIWM